MKKLYLLVTAYLYVFINVSTAQVTDTTAWWTWLGGATQQGASSATYGKYGTKLVPSATNSPSLRGTPASWKDTAGNLYLFGGYGGANQTANPNSGLLNDLWKYDIITYQWTWVNGSDSANRYGIYGTAGSANSLNHPPGRFYCAAWTGRDGNFWLFGGIGNGESSGSSATYWNDLWKYNPATNQWAYVKGPKQGNQNGLYQAKGVAAPVNMPGARGFSATWVDTAGNLWLFGGQGYPGGTGAFGYLNDLWKYNPLTNQWTWVAGDTTINNFASFGTQQVESSGNKPGARGNIPGAWVDAANNLWLFGAGGGYVASGSVGKLADLWKFNVASGNWTFMGGSASINANGVYGTQLVPGNGNYPGGRYTSAFWKDVNGNFWLYGGNGQAATGSSAVLLGDLWRYNPVTYQWTWMKGPQTGGLAVTPGTQYVPAPTNTPGGRQVMVSWTDNAGNFWTYGGGGSSNYYNDVWRLAPTVTIPGQPDLFTAAPASVCQNASNVTYTVPLVNGAASYEWSYTGSGVTFGNATTTLPSNTVNFSGTATSGTIHVRAVNSAGAGPYRDTGVTVNSVPATPGNFTTSSASVCQGQNSVQYTVPTVSGAAIYEWSYTGSGATFASGSSTATPTNNVNFSGSATGGDLKVSAKNSCGTSTARSVTITVGSVPATPGSFTTSSASVCQGQNSVQYTVPTVSGATSYEWSYTGSGGAFTSGASTATPTNNVNFSGSATGGNIQVSAKNNCGTSTARSVTVTVGSAPATPGNFTTSSASVCQGQNSVQYTVPTVGGAISYEWSYTGSGATFTGGASTATPTNNVNFSGSATGGNIQVSAKNSCGTSIARSVTVTANTPPAATVSPLGPVDICEDDSVTLTAGSGTGYSYQWKNGGTNVGTGGNTYTAHTTGNYKVVVTGTGGCKDSTQAVPVTVYNRPSGVLTPGDTAFCEGGVITLSVSTTDTGLSYRWKNGAATISLATASFLEINETGAYTVVLSRSNTTGACSDTTPAVTVTVYPLPAADIAWDGLILHTNGGYAGYQWSTGGQPVAGATDSTFQPVADGGYAVTVTDSNGCSKTSPVYNITVGINDLTAAGMQVRVYPNPSDGTVHIAAPVPVNVTLSGMDGRLLLQQAGATIIDIGGYAAGVYLLRISNTDGVIIGVERIILKSR